MFEEFLQKTYYGNTVLDWLIALAIVVAALLVVKALYWIFGNIVKQFTKKTKTRLDDIVIDMIEEPIVFIVTIGVGMLLVSRHLWRNKDTLTDLLDDAVWLLLGGTVTGQLSDAGSS